MLLTTNSRYSYFWSIAQGWNNCRKGYDCEYSHDTKNPPPFWEPRTGNARDPVFKFTEWTFNHSPARKTKAIEEAREVANWDMNETYRDGQEEVRLEYVQDAVSGLEGQSVPPIAGDEPPNEVQRGDFDAIFWSIYSEFLDQQQQILKVKRLDELVWNSFGAQTQQLFIDSCTDDRSR